MTNPSTKSIDAALKSIEAQERDPNHPRSLARAAVAKFILDRDKGEKSLPIVNVRDSGAPVLDVDHVIRRAQPEHAPKLITEQHRSLWSRLWRR